MQGLFLKLRFSHHENTGEDLSRNIKWNDGKGKQQNIPNDVPIQRVRAEHLPAEKDQQDLHAGNRRHNQKEAFIFSNIRKEADATRSRIESIKNTAKDEKCKECRHKTDKIR